jgi:hypothetical protein
MDAQPRSCSPSGAVGKTRWVYSAPREQGKCVGCKNEFRGQGDRCQQCRTKLRLRHKRKRR